VLGTTAPFIATDQFAWNIFCWGQASCTASPCAGTTILQTAMRFPMNTVGVGSPSNLQFYEMVISDMNYTLRGAAPLPSAPTPTDPAFFNAPVSNGGAREAIGGAILMGHSQSSSFRGCARTSFGLSSLDISLQSERYRSA